MTRRILPPTQGSQLDNHLRRIRALEALDHELLDWMAGESEPVTMTAPLDTETITDWVLLLGGVGQKSFSGETGKPQIIRSGIYYFVTTINIGTLGSQPTSAYGGIYFQAIDGGFTPNLTGYNSTISNFRHMPTGLFTAYGGYLNPGPGFVRITEQDIENAGGGFIVEAQIQAIITSGTRTGNIQLAFIRLGSTVSEGGDDGNGWYSLLP